MQKIAGSRIEAVRSCVDEILLGMTDFVARRCAYVHLYGVSQMCAVIARKRNVSAELAIIAGMLHDIAAYKNAGCHNHAHESAAMADKILGALNLFSGDEHDSICGAVYNHSDKESCHPPLTEVLVDADVACHYLYNPYQFSAASDAVAARLSRLRTEFCIGTEYAD